MKISWLVNYSLGGARPFTKVPCLSPSLKDPVSSIHYRESLCRIGYETSKLVQHRSKGVCHEKGSS